jgi:hypothetical protein
MRIAVLARARDMSSYYRAYEPVEALGRRGHGSIVIADDRPPPAAVFDCDVALISRWLGKGTEQFVRQLRRAGVAVVWQIDDAVEQSTFVRRTPQRTRELTMQVVAMLRLVDVVVTTTEPLLAHFGARTSTPIHVVQNYLGPQFSDKLQGDPHPGLVLGWAAWMDHQADWRALSLQKTLTRLLGDHPELHVESLGPLDLRLPPARYTQTPPVKFEYLARRLARFDVAIAPIANTRFNAGRSNIKVKEYAALGIPWLASPIGPYEGLGEEQGGRLVADDRWYEELDAIVRDDGARRTLAKRGRAWANTQTIDRNTGPWEEAFHHAIERARHRRSGAA